MQMKIEIRPLAFDHLITLETKRLKSEWQEPYYEMEEFILNEELYKNGPVFFSFNKDGEAEGQGLFTFYLPISGPAELKEESEFGYLGQFRLEQALVLRQADQETDINEAEKKLRQYALKQNIVLDDTVFCVLLDVYGEYIIDLYIPIKERSAA